MEKTAFMLNKGIFENPIPLKGMVLANLPEEPAEPKCDYEIL